MKKLFLFCCSVVLCAALLCLAGCDGARESEKLLNEIQYYGYPAKNPNQNIWDFLDCSKIPESSQSSLTLLGFQVGVTTYQEMLETLEYDEVFWNYDYGHLVIEEGGPSANHKWRWIHACFSDGRLSAIQTWNNDDYPATIEGFVEEFGVPDLITWAGRLDERIAVWMEIGLIGSFSDGSGNSKLIFLIPPMELSEFEGSWLAERIQYTLDYYDQDIKKTGDYYIYDQGGMRWYIREDPWGYTMSK